MSQTNGAQYRYSIGVKDMIYDNFFRSTSYYSMDRIKESIKTILENWPQYPDQNTNSQSQIDRWLILRYVRGLWMEWLTLHYLKLNDLYDPNGTHIENTLMGGMQVVANSPSNLSGLPLKPRNTDYGTGTEIKFGVIQDIFKGQLPLLQAYKKVRSDVTPQNVNIIFAKDSNYFLELLNPEDLASMQELMRQEYRARQQSSNGLFGFESQDADMAFADAFLKVGVTVLFAYIGGAAISSFSSTGASAAGAATTGAETGASAGVVGAATESGTLAGSTGLLGSTTTASITGAGITTAEVAEGGGLLAALGSAAEKIGSQVVENKILGAITPTKPASTPAKTTTPIAAQTENQNSLLKYLTPIATTLLFLL